MAIYKVSPFGAGTKDGSSWANAMDFDSAATLMETEAGHEFHLMKGLYLIGDPGNDSNWTNKAAANGISNLEHCTDCRTANASTDWYNIGSFNTSQTGNYNCTTGILVKDNTTIIGSYVGSDTSPDAHADVLNKVGTSGAEPSALSDRTLFLRYPYTRSGSPIGDFAIFSIVAGRGAYTFKIKGCDFCDWNSPDLNQINLQNYAGYTCYRDVTFYSGRSSNVYSGTISVITGLSASLITQGFDITVEDCYNPIIFCPQLLAVNSTLYGGETLEDCRSNFTFKRCVGNYALFYQNSYVGVASGTLPVAPLANMTFVNCLLISRQSFGYNTTTWDITSLPGFDASNKTVYKTKQGTFAVLPLWDEEYVYPSAEAYANVTAASVGTKWLSKEFNTFKFICINCSFFHKTDDNPFATSATERNNTYSTFIDTNFGIQNHIPFWPLRIDTWVHDADGDLNVNAGIKQTHTRTVNGLMDSADDVRFSDLNSWCDIRDAGISFINWKDVDINDNLTNVTDLTADNLWRPILVNCSWHIIDEDHPWQYAQIYVGGDYSAEYKTDNLRYVLQANNSASRAVTTWAPAHTYLADIRNSSIPIPPPGGISAGSSCKVYDKYYAMAAASYEALRAENLMTWVWNPLTQLLKDGNVNNKNRGTLANFIPGEALNTEGAYLPGTVIDTNVPAAVVPSVDILGRSRNGGTTNRITVGAFEASNTRLSTKALNQYISE